MYVICDIEWIELESKILFPTQITTVRVNSKWNPISCFSSFIRPPQGIWYDKKHVAFNGGNIEDFKSSQSFVEVFSSLYKWLEKDDVLLWWFGDSDKVFRKLSVEFDNRVVLNKSIVVLGYIQSCLENESLCSFNQYAVASHLNIPIFNYTKHFSFHDVMTAIEVFKVIKYPSDNFTDSVDVSSVVENKYSQFAYYYDTQSGIIHSNTCKYLLKLNTKLIGYPTLFTPVKKRYKPCECCKSDYRNTLRTKNADTISRTIHTFVYSPDSNIYHRRDCNIVLNSRSVMGTCTLEKVLKTGRKPCKICRPPTTIDEVKQTMPRIEKKTNKSVQSDNKKDDDIRLPFIATKDELRAVKRQKVAAIERSDKLREGLSQDELNNIYALTQPRYAFWAAKGHKHFHLRSCPTMKNLAHLCGFETYQDAIKARFVPCRHCKPTSKHDLKLSVPIYNQIREHESIQDLETKCKSVGVECSIDDKFVHIKTPVGKWIVHADSLPIKLEHINLSRNPDDTKYHQQHRVFLSLTDVFLYIMRHDSIDSTALNTLICSFEHDYIS